MPSITTLLIANRGEIAVRIARTAHRLGIETVGVYSEADRNALHVDAVDRAVALGGTTPADSYLHGDAIIAAALDTGATAIHPGYGFLAENADFAASVTGHGLVWVGPTPEQIRLLGDKIAAKRAAVDAGVATTDVIELVDGEIPTGVALPALVKAAAGGGGRGMRVVRSPEALPDAVESARREAVSAFGDGTVFIEPFIERGRHVEVQIVGDTHGNVIHLGDRECSIQRRNQKIIEEAPSPGIDDSTRRRLHEGAVALARSVGYVGVGTVEFMVADGSADEGPPITFLEVNTRLQVEHPVTEAITGIDLVELQLHVAQGWPLPLSQGDVTTSGHAIEARVVAEDPASDWMPSTGIITEFVIGGIDDPVRVDAGFRQGSAVSADYDSLLAKVISHAADRPTAARRLARTLKSVRVRGVRTNAATLSAIVTEPDFLAGATFTSYLADHPAVGGAPTLASEHRSAHFIAAAFALERINRARDRVTGFAPSGWRNLRTQGTRRTLILDDFPADVHGPPSDVGVNVGASGSRQPLAAERGVPFHAEYVLSRPGETVEPQVWLGQWPEPGPDGALPPDDRQRPRVRLIDRTDSRQTIEVDGVRHAIDVSINDSDSGRRVETASPAGIATWIEPPRFDDHDAAVEVGGGPISPLPGTVIAVHAAAGDQVADGEVLMVVEAMKMEHKIVAPAAALVIEVRYAIGDRVDAGDLLVALEQVDG